jgi:hypothetical protein
MTNPVLKGPFLRVQRLFPQDPQALSVEMDRAYTDIASNVNSRSLGVYPSNQSIQNGDSWYLNGLKYQGFRQFYTFTSAGNIPHGINLTNIFAITQIYGTFTDGSSWYPLPYVNVVAANNQVSVTVSGTNIVITAGGGAPPAITRGYVVLEWLSQA